MKNGWHKICGYDIYVNHGKVIAGMKLNRNGQPIPAYPFRLGSYGWTPACKLKVSAFKAGMQNNTIMMM